MLADVRPLLTPRWLLFHALVWILVAGFLLLGYWQVTRAFGGNALSFGYSIQWPAFAGFVIFVWIRELRRALRSARPAEEEPAAAKVAAKVEVKARKRTRAAPRTGPAYDDSDDEQLAAYNRYLAWLNENPQASPADYREVR
jgi:hypothetical protein